MNHFLPLANTTAAADTGMFSWITVLVWVGLIAVLYFAMIRPQSKKRKKKKKCVKVRKLVMKLQQSAALWDVLLPLKRIPILL